MTNKEKILNALKNKSFLKVISGIKNYDKQKALDVAMAAEMGGASALDICDNQEILNTIRAAVQLPLFVSSIDPKKLIQSQKYGADALEIGNYESFYKEGKMFTPKEILEITKEVKKSLSGNVLLCCTVPATLEIQNQVKLAKQLLDLGVDILQTEGFAQTTPASDRKDTSYIEILKAASTLTNTLELRKALPEANIICASGITLTTAALAVSMGASGIGIGNYINSLTSQNEMTERVKEIMDAVHSIASYDLSKTKTFALR